VIPVQDSHGNFGIDSVPSGEYLIRFHEGKIIAHQLSILTESSKLLLAVTEVKEDTSEIILLANQNQNMLSDIKELLNEGTLDEGSSTSDLIAIDQVLVFYESEIGAAVCESDDITKRVLRVLMHYWSGSNKRSRSMKNQKKLIRIIFWLAHPHKDSTVSDSSKTDLLKDFSNRCCVLAVRMLIQVLVKICDEEFLFAVCLHLPCRVTFWIRDTFVCADHREGLLLNQASCTKW